MSHNSNAPKSMSCFTMVLFGQAARDKKLPFVEIEKRRRKNLGSDEVRRFMSFTVGINVDHARKQPNGLHTHSVPSCDRQEYLGGSSSKFQHSSKKLKRGPRMYFTSLGFSSTYIWSNFGTIGNLTNKSGHWAHSRHGQTSFKACDRTQPSCIALILPIEEVLPVSQALSNAGYRRTSRTE